MGNYSGIAICAPARSGGACLLERKQKDKEQIKTKIKCGGSTEASPQKRFDFVSFTLSEHRRCRRISCQLPDSTGVYQNIFV